MRLRRRDVHGTVASYTARRCRCNLCRQAMMEYQTSWRKRHRAYNKRWMRNWRKVTDANRR